jgi:hypothetical protein
MLLPCCNNKLLGRCILALTPSTIPAGEPLGDTAAVWPGSTTIQVFVDGEALLKLDGIHSAGQAAGLTAQTWGPSTMPLGSQCSLLTYAEPNDFVIIGAGAQAFIGWAVNRPNRENASIQFAFGTGLIAAYTATLYYEQMRVYSADVAATAPVV